MRKTKQELAIQMVKEERNALLKRKVVELSIHNYILSKPPRHLCWSRLGTEIHKDYDMNDLACELGVKPEKIKEWIKTGEIPSEYHAVLIRKEILPIDWRLYK